MRETVGHTRVVLKNEVKSENAKKCQKCQKKRQKTPKNAKNQFFIESRAIGSLSHRATPKSIKTTMYPPQKPF